MRKILSDLSYLFPVMFYFLLEAVIVGVFIMLMWNAFLSNYWGHFGYLQIVTIYWIAKMLFFDIFKLIGSFNPPQDKEQ